MPTKPTTPTKKSALLIAIAMPIVGASSSALCFCVDDGFEDGRFACSVAKASSSSDECPPGLICASDGRCRTRELGLAGEGGPGPTDLEDGGPQTDVVTPPDGPIDPCSVAWTTSSTDRAPSALALDPDGHLFVGGSATPKRGWIAELNPCDGGVIREKVFDVPQATEPVIQSMAIAGNDIVIGGVLNGSAAGMFGRFDRTTLASSGFTSITGAGLVGLDHLTIADDGAVWLGGAQEIFAPTQTGWVVRITTGLGPPTCNIRPSQAVGGLLPDTSGRVLTLLNEANHTMLLDVVQTSCALTVSGGGAISIESPKFTGGWSLAGTRAATIIVGTNGAGPNGNERGFIAQRNGLDANAFTTTFLDPAPNGGIDIVVRGVTETDQTALFAGGTHNATLTGGTPVVYRYALPLTANAMPVWSTPPYLGTIAPIQAMIAAPVGKEGIYVAGAQLPNRQQGAIAKCRKADGCKR